MICSYNMASARISSLSPAQLIGSMHHAHHAFFKQSLDPTASVPHDKDDAILAFEGSKEQLQTHMPQLVFVNGLWRTLIDFADSNQLLQTVAAARAFAGALAGGATPDQYRGLFFEGVAEACYVLQSIPPQPRAPRRLLPWPWQRAPPPPQHQQGVVVGDRVVANIVFSNSNGRITVHNIRHV